MVNIIAGICDSSHTEILEWGMYVYFWHFSFLCPPIEHSFFCHFHPAVLCSFLPFVLKLLDVDGAALPWCPLQVSRDPQGKGRCVPIVQQICYQVSWCVYTFCTNLTAVLLFFGIVLQQKKTVRWFMYCYPSGPPIKFVKQIIHFCSDIYVLVLGMVCHVRYLGSDYRGVGFCLEIMWTVYR